MISPLKSSPYGRLTSEDEVLRKDRLRPAPARSGHSYRNPTAALAERANEI